MLSCEFLHRLGMIDVCDTGTAFGILSERENTLLLASQADESIMGNDIEPCIEDYTCTSAELDEVCLDLYDRFNIGLTVNQNGFDEELRTILYFHSACSCGDGFIENPNINGNYEDCDNGNLNSEGECSSLCTLEIISEKTKYFSLNEP